MERVLPEKMKLNLESLEKLSLREDFLTMLRTLFVVFGKEYR